MRSLSRSDGSWAPLASRVNGDTMARMVEMATREIRARRARKEKKVMLVSGEKRVRKEIRERKVILASACSSSRT